MFLMQYEQEHLFAIHVLPLTTTILAIITKAIIKKKMLKKKHIINELHSSSNIAKNTATQFNDCRDLKKNLFKFYYFFSLIVYKVFYIQFKFKRNTTNMNQT